jgi:H+/Cl- antiporter ClcA
MPVSVVTAPFFAFASILYVRLIRWADKGKPHGWQRFIAPVIVLGLLGVVSVRFPEILGNGKDLSQLLLTDQVGLRLVLALLLLKPLATILCMRSGIPGGLFTPSLTFGALLGATLGHAWSAMWPGMPPGFFALLGAGAVLSATTQGPISAVVLMLELTGRDRSFILPLILIAALSTLIARSVEPRSIYDARLSDEQIESRQKCANRNQTKSAFRNRRLWGKRRERGLLHWNEWHFLILDTLAQISESAFIANARFEQSPVWKRALPCSRQLTP